MRVRPDIRRAFPSEQEPALGGRLGAQPGAILGVVATLRHSFFNAVVRNAGFSTSVPGRGEGGDG